MQARPFIDQPQYLRSCLRRNSHAHPPQVRIPLTRKRKFPLYF
jgi:hypothetical protein